MPCLEVVHLDFLRGFPGSSDFPMFSLARAALVVPANVPEISRQTAIRHVALQDYSTVI